MSQQKHITVHVDAETYNKLRHKLLDQKKSFSQWVREQIEKEVK